MLFRLVNSSQITTMKLAVRTKNGETKIVDNVTLFEKHSNGVIVDFENGEAAEFQTVLSGIEE